MTSRSRQFEVDLTTVEGLESVRILAESIADMPNEHDREMAVYYIDKEVPELGELIHAHLEQMGTVYKPEGEKASG